MDVAENTPKRLTQTFVVQLWSFGQRLTIKKKPLRAETYNSSFLHLRDCSGGEAKKMPF